MTPFTFTFNADAADAAARSAGRLGHHRPLGPPKGMPVSDATYERGLQIRREMWGSEATDAQLAGADDFMSRLQDLVTGYCFGENWSRELLPRKIRSMITIAMLAGQGREPEIRVHVRGALANGVSREVARHRRAHVAEADESDALDRGAHEGALPSSASIWANTSLAERNPLTAAGTPA